MLRNLLILPILLLGACGTSQFDENREGLDVFGCAIVKADASGGSIVVGGGVSTDGYKCFTTSKEFTPQLDRMINSLILRQL